LNCYDQIGNLFTSFSGFNTGLAFYLKHQKRVVGFIKAKYFFPILLWDVFSGKEN